MFGCDNDRLFPEKYTVKDHISNTKLEKGDHYYIQKKKNVPKSSLNFIRLLRVVITPSVTSESTGR